MGTLIDIIIKDNLSIPSLDSILPERWNPYTNNEDIEIDEMVSRYNLPDFSSMSKSERELLDKLIGEVRDSRYKRLEVAKELLGLHDVRLKIVADEIETLFGGRFGEEAPLITDYAPVLSFLSTFFGHDLKGRKIVEVGTGNDGIVMLGYLSRKGAECYGVDCAVNPSEEKLKEHKVSFIKDRWENISSHFEKNSVDAIYLQYMHPQPHIGGPFYDYKAYDALNDTRTIGLEEMRKRRRNSEISFQKYVAKEMYNILKPHGVFTLRILNQNITELSDFLAYEYCFTEKGFTLQEPKIERYGKYLQIFQKTS